MKIVKGTMQKKEKEKISITKRVFSTVKYRMRGGELFENVANDISEKARFNRLAFDVFVLFAGNKISYLLFPTMRFEKTGEYTADGFLYHITPVKSLNEIKQKGIVSNRGCVFLTDDIEYYINDIAYPDWKATVLRENTDFCVLKINVSSLKKQHKIYCINRAHEFITKKVEPEFIIFE